MGIIGSIRKHSWVAVALVGIAIVAFIFQDLSKNKKLETLICHFMASTPPMAADKA